MTKTADNYQTSITGRFPPLASTGGNDAEAIADELNAAYPAIKAVLGEVGK